MARNLLRSFNGNKFLRARFCNSNIIALLFSTANLSLLKQHRNLLVSYKMESSFTQRIFKSNFRSGDVSGGKIFA